MAGVARFTVSVEPELLEQFDRWVKERGFANRSQGVRDLIHRKIHEQTWGEGDEETVATVTYVYDHHKRELLERLAHLHHTHLVHVVSSLHVHLDHQHCLEVSVLRGPAAAVRALADQTISLKGVLTGTVSIGVRPALLADRAHHHPGDPARPHEHR